MTNPQALIDDAYTLWLKHAPLLYDFCTTHVLEWPSAAVAFLSDSRREIPGRDYSVQQVAVGTTSPQVNYVNVYHCFLPCAIDEMEDMDEEDLEAFYGYSGKFTDVAPLMQRYCRVVHDGPVSKILPMPQKPQVLATRGVKPYIYLYDIGKRRTEPEDTSVRTDIRLKGHRDEGKALDWCKCSEGYIASGANDHQVNIYDIRGPIELIGTRQSVDMAPVLELKGHTDAVRGVSWHSTHDAVLASVGADKKLNVWDIRSDGPQDTLEIHRSPINDISFHPHAAFLFATCAADKSVRCWDMRKTRKPLTEFVGHMDEVMGLEWAPFNDTVMLTYSKDRTVICWDLGKAQATPVAGQDDLAKPAQVFKHCGHTAQVRAATWCPAQEDEWSVASVDDNNVLQLWAPYEGVYNDQADKEVYNTDVV